MSRNLNRLAVAAVLALGSPSAALAQELPFSDVADDGSATDATALTAAVNRAPRITVSPYIEASQALFAQLSPSHDTFTYTTLAAGVDAAIAGRNNQGSVSLRYERRFGWGDNAIDSDTLSGVARFQTAIVPRAINFEIGAMAARSSVENNGSTVNGLELGNSTQVYSVYAGPSVATRTGDVAINGHYYFGYNRVTTPDTLVLAPGQDPVDLFASSTLHNAELHFGTKAGEPLPVGLGAGVGYNREEISNLDQRVEDFHARGDVAVPVTSDLQLVGGVGWEKVKVSSRDAQVDTLTGLPVIGPDGRFVTDTSAPRQIAFESEGLIWDAGVLWRPSRRTAFEAHVGKRYGSTTYYGSLAYAPNTRMNANVSVYDSLTGLGGLLNQSLIALPTQFDALRNPLNGDLNGCVVSQGPVSAGQGTCLTGALSSLRSSVFRSRGVNASLGLKSGRFGYGLGAGYDRRRYIAAPNSVLGVTNLTIDENWWIGAYLKGQIDAQSSAGATVWANWFDSGDALAGKTNGVGATAYYNRSISSRLSATAAIGLNGVNREDLEDVWTAQALAGVRYQF
ncbi:preprotein translocase subunit YajC [Novosphingobium sp.]|uniref:preprotein translocase subunit YajC n=1 Tax=Novosphingobium sp. TaxID=1874826 RepID=UPI0025DDC260|nr:preprotein translocase subunit YajC [Novosphingobium sp.]